jgi:hypothetical protein
MLIAWIGIPEFNQWRADHLVDELCVKDGGHEVYEVISIPPEEFNKYWLTNLGGIGSVKKGAKYYAELTSTDIQGDSDKSAIEKLVIWKTETRIIRVVDGKIMAKLVSYTRRGGDPVGPWHPSHYRCPKNDFSHEVFVKK